MVVSTEQTWPGQRLGLPAEGSGAVAGWGRRIVALCIDWVLSMLVIAAVTGDNPWAQSASGRDAYYYAVGLCAVEIWLFTTLIGGSAGQIVLRVGVRRVQGGRLDPVRALVRTVLLFLVVPPLVYNRDQRGLHDLAVGSIAVRR